MDKFAIRLKELRQEKGLTLKQLAENTGIGLSTLGHWEKGTFEAKINALIILAKYFEVTADYLLGLEDD